MTDIKNFTVAQLQRALEIKEQIETLQTQLDSIEEGEAAAPSAALGGRRKYRMSKAGRAAIAAAVKARWAKLHGKKSDKPATGKKRRKMSAAARAKIAAAARARWAKAKQAGKTTL